MDLIVYKAKECMHINYKYRYNIAILNDELGGENYQRFYNFLPDGLLCSLICGRNKKAGMVS